MRDRIDAYLVAVAILATLGPAGKASGFSHSGRVVDASTNQPIEYVLVRAATSDKLGEGGECPKYDGFAGQTSTDAKGAFNLIVNDSAQLYFVTFCRAQYAVFTPDEPNQNVNDGRPVNPVPAARLWRLPGTATQMHASIEFLRDDTRSAVLALRRIAGDEFNAALRSLAGPEQALVNSWIVETTASRAPTTKIRLIALQPTDNANSAKAMSSALNQLLASQRMTLSYLQKASPAHFETQINDFLDLRRYLIAKEPAPPQVEVNPPRRDCGMPRDDVAAAVDDAAAHIGDEIDVTVKDLLSIKRPTSVSSYMPRSPVESHEFRIYAQIRSIKTDPDGSIRLLLTDGEDEIAAIIPKPCSDQSYFAEGIRQSRSLVEPTRLNDPLVARRVIVWGLGFFPRATLSAPAPPIELRPVVKIKLQDRYDWMRYLAMQP